MEPARRASRNEGGSRVACSVLGIHSTTCNFLNVRVAGPNHKAAIDLWCCLWYSMQTYRAILLRPNIVPPLDLFFSRERFTFNIKDGVMVYSHCTGTGLGPVEGPNEKYSTMLKCSHWFETGTGTRIIIPYWASPIPCADRGPIPVQRVNKPLYIVSFQAQWRKSVCYSPYLFNILCNFDVAF